jgi:hypothetical protein
MPAKPPMPPDVETLRFLPALADEFSSDDGLRHIAPMDEDAEDYWDTRLAGVCIPCREARDAAIRQQQPPRGLTMPDVYAIAAWRPVRDAEDACEFLAEHADCAVRPRLDIGIRWD